MPELAPNKLTISGKECCDNKAGLFLFSFCPPLRFCSTNGLSIMNTLHEKSNIHRRGDIPAPKSVIMRQELCRCAADERCRVLV